MTSCYFGFSHAYEDVLFVLAGRLLIFREGLVEKQKPEKKQEKLLKKGEVQG